MFFRSGAVPLTRGWPVSGRVRVDGKIQRYLTLFLCDPICLASYIRLSRHVSAARWAFTLHLGTGQHPLPFSFSPLFPFLPLEVLGAFFLPSLDSLPPVTDSAGQREDVRPGPWHPVSCSLLIDRSTDHAPFGLVGILFFWVPHLFSLH